jgi:hypothetical protein
MYTQEQLVMVQNQIKQQIDQHRFEHSFKKGDQVFICLQPYK